MRAYVTQVQIGNLEIEGLMTEKGEYRVAVPQLVALNLASQFNPTRDTKAILGKDSKLVKYKTEFNPNPVNTISLIEFEKVVFELAIKGNEFAANLVRALVGLSLTQLFSDAFGVKFEKEERQNYLKERKAHVPAYKIYSSWGAVDGLKSGSAEYGQRCRRLKAQCSLPADVSIEDYTYEQVGALKQAEYAYDLLRKAGMSHDDAINLIR